MRGNAQVDVMVRMVYNEARVFLSCSCENRDSVLLYASWDE